jgi:hypothetical protein
MSTNKTFTSRPTIQLQAMRRSELVEIRDLLTYGFERVGLRRR